MKLRIDIYQLTLGVALAVDIPLMMGAMRLGHGIDSPTAWFFTEMPGIGLGVIGLASNAMVGSYRLLPGIDEDLRATLNRSWRLSFACIIWVLVGYLMAASTMSGDKPGVPISELTRVLLPVLPETVHGLLLVSWFFALIGVPHINGPSLLAISAAEQASDAKAKAEGLEKEHDAVVDRALGATKVDTQKEIIQLLGDRERMTARDIEEALGMSYQRVKTNADKLVAAGALEASAGKPTYYSMAAQMDLP